MLHQKTNPENPVNPVENSFGSGLSGLCEPAASKNAAAKNPNIRVSKFFIGFFCRTKIVLFSRPGSKKLPRVIKLCFQTCYLKFVVQDWAFQIGFLSEMFPVVLQPVPAGPRMYFLSKPSRQQKCCCKKSKLMVSSLFLPDRNKFCFPDRAARNCRE